MEMCSGPWLCRAATAVCTAASFSQIGEYRIAFCLADFLTFSGLRLACYLHLEAGPKKDSYEGGSRVGC